MEKLLLQNLSELQSLDEVLRSGAPLRAISGRYLHAVMFEPDEAKRRDSIGKLEKDVVRFFKDQAQPAARAQAVRSARRILDRIGGPHDLSSPDFRRRVLIEGTARPETRVRIVQALVNDRANTLENRLAAYWLEPGSSAHQKLDRLVALHQDQQQRLAAYQEKLGRYYGGELANRPAPPRLDYLERFTGDVTQDVRQQARRAGTDAETATFAAKGYQQFAWITVNASEACPDCRARQGEVGDMAYWAQRGKPGSGSTVCGSNCFCMLVPQETIHAAPQLAKGIEQPRNRA